MLRDIIAIFGLFKAAPPAIDIYSLPPLSSPLPVELREKLGEKDDPYCGLHPIHLGIENLSSIVLEKIRIKLPSRSVYSPTVNNRDMQRPVAWQNDSERAEIFIESLDPGDSIHMVVYPSESDAFSFGKPEILIEGRRVSPLQAQLGFVKKKPYFSLLMLLVLISICSSICVSVFTYYPSIFPNSDRALLQAAADSLEGGCIFTAEEVTSRTLSEIVESPAPKQILLKANNAKNMDELMGRKKIVVCK